MKRKIRFSIGILITLFFIYLSFKKVNFANLFKLIKNTDLKFLIFAIIVFFIGYTIRVERWRITLLRENRNLKWINCAGPFFASITYNNILPLRAGDILRAFTFGPRLKISNTVSIASLLLERILDISMLFLFLCVSFIFFGNIISTLLGIGSVILLFICLLVFLFLFYPFLFEKVFYRNFGFLKRINPLLFKKIEFVLFQLIDFIKSIKEQKVLLRLFFLSFFAWLCEAFVFWLIAHSISSLNIKMASWVAMPIGTLSTIIPSTPGYIGTFDYFTSQSMIISGNSIQESLSFAILTHLVLWLPSTLVGCLYLIKKLKF